MFIAEWYQFSETLFIYAAAVYSCVYAAHFFKERRYGLSFLTLAAGYNCYQPAMAIYVFLILLHVCYLSFSRNFGKEAAMYAGFQNVKGDFVAVMDADLQDPPQLLPEMLEIIKSGEYDSVAARRAGRKGEPVLRSALARGFYWIMNRISDTDIARDFRLMKKEMADAVAEMGEYNRFSKGIFGWVGFRTYWMPYENVQRLAGKSKWNFWKLFRYAVDGILNFSHVPLHISSFFGGVMTFAAFILLIAVVIWRICFGDPVAGWASMICAVIFMGGIQLFCMGIMGQYVAKIYMESKHRPHYIIAESSREGTKKLDECRKVFLFWFIQGNRNISLLHNGMKL